MQANTTQPARLVKVQVGRRTYRVALDPDTGAALYVKGLNAVRGEIALHVDGRIAQQAIRKARGEA